MSKIKDKIEDDKEFANKELESLETPYRFDEENHIHLYNGQPLYGTSTVFKVLSKPLTWWASGLAVEKFGWINKGNAKSGWTPKEERLSKAIAGQNKVKELNAEEYLNLLDEAYSAHSKKLDTSAQSGTDMHALMEDYIKHCIKNNGSKPDADYKTDSKQVDILIDWSIKKVKRFIWSEVHCFSKDLWVGGISDVGFEDIDGNYAILDFKSSKEAYLSQFWQCVGYAMQIEENGGLNKDGLVVFRLDKPISYVAILPFGMDKPEVQYNYDMVGGREAFKATLLLHTKLN